VLEDHRHVDAIGGLRLGRPADADPDAVAGAVAVGVERGLDEDDLLDRIREVELGLCDAVLDLQPRRRLLVRGAAGATGMTNATNAASARRDDIEPLPWFDATQSSAAIMRRMDRSVGWRAALLQGLLIAAVAVALALALPRSFFEDWGWLAGPAAWGACALMTGAALRLPLGAVVVGAGLSGLPMLAGVDVVVHWLGLPLGLAAFGLWCGRLAARRVAVAV
jgi:hypothetical protein